MRIIVAGLSQNYGGVEAFFLTYYRELIKNGIQFDFLAYDEHLACEKEFELNGAKIFHLPHRRANIVEYYKKLTTCFEENAHKYYAIWLNDCLLCNVEPLRLAKKYGIQKRIVHAHNSKSVERVDQTILHTLHKWNIGSIATDYWACSQYAGEFFYPLKIRESDRYKIIKNAIQTEKYRFNEQIRRKERQKLKIEETILVGCVGRLNTQKNHQYLIDIFKALLDMKVQAHLVLIGTGDREEEIRQKIAELELQENVTFLGHCEDVERKMQALDVLVMPSLYEGLPVTAVEAQAAGLPCVLSSTITADVRLTDLVEFVPLESPPKEWAEMILQQAQKARKDTKVEIEKAGYDVHTAAKEMKELLEGL